MTWRRCGASWKRRCEGGGRGKLSLAYASGFLAAAGAFAGGVCVCEGVAFGGQLPGAFGSTKFKVGGVVSRFAVNGDALGEVGAVGVGAGALYFDRSDNGLLELFVSLEETSLVFHVGGGSDGAGVVVNLGGEERNEA